MLNQDVKIIKGYGTRQIFSVTSGERKTVAATVAVVLFKNSGLFIKNTGLCIIFLRRI